MIQSICIAAVFVTLLAACTSRSDQLNQIEPTSTRDVASPDSEVSIPEPTAAPTPESSLVPSPTATLAPVISPSPTSTIAETATVVLVESPSPTPTPSPTNTPTPQPTATPVPSPTATATPTQMPIDLSLVSESYENTSIGYQLRYPSGWRVEGENEFVWISNLPDISLVINISPHEEESMDSVRARVTDFWRQFDPDQIESEDYGVNGSLYEVHYIYLADPTISQNLVFIEGDLLFDITISLSESAADESLPIAEAMLASFKTTSPQLVENGDEPEHATSISLDKSFVGFINHSDDADYFKVQLDANTPYFIELQSGELWSKTVTIYAVNGGAPLATDDGFQFFSDGLLEWKPEESGIYLIRVNSTDVFDIGSYTIRVDNQVSRARLLLDRDLNAWKLATEEFLGISPGSHDSVIRIMTREEYVVWRNDSVDSDPDEQADDEAESREFEVGLQTLKALGIVDVDLDLLNEVDAFVDVGVSGLYRPDSDELIVVVESDASTLTESEAMTFIHEYTHLLQDVVRDAFRDMMPERGADEDTAFDALVEGEATYTSILVALLQRGSDFLDEGFEQESDQAQALPDFSYYLSESFGFPYAAGTNFVTQIVNSAVPFPEPTSYEESQENLRVIAKTLSELHSRPPITTEQVLHPEKYVTNEQALTVDLLDDNTLAGAGWTVVDRSLWGESGLRLWLEALISERTGARELQQVFLDMVADAAEGWGGDANVLLDSECGHTASLTLIEWDDPLKDANEFNLALRQVLEQDPRFSTVSSTDAAIPLFVGPAGTVAVWDSTLAERSIVATADSPDTATGLVSAVSHGAEIPVACE